MSERIKGERVSVCGTRAVVKIADDDYRVVCAACDAGGSRLYKTRSLATAGASRNSGRPCMSCGAR